MGDATRQMHTAVFSTGERFPVLLGIEGIPMSLPTRYVVDRHRDKHQTTTIRAIVRAISHFYEWSTTIAAPFDPEVRLRVGSLLDTTEIMGLQRFLRAGRRQNVLVFPQRPVARSRNATVIGNTDLNNQLDRIRDFLVWAAECVRVPRFSSSEINGLRSRISAVRLTPTTAAAKYGLTIEQQGELMRIVDATRGNSGNPFNRQVRARNHTIVRLLFETGIRRGELCKLRVEDVNLRGSDGGSISIVRNPDDLWDPRKDEPEVKTLNRRIPLRRATKDLLFDYLLKHRGRCRHPYFFTSSRNAVPMDVTAVNRIFTRIRASSSAFAHVDLTPHILRHTFEENLARQAATLGWTEKRISDVTNYLSGWTEMSKQAINYQRRANEEFAMTAMTKLYELNDQIDAAARRKANDDIRL